MAPLGLGYLGAWRLARPFGSQRAKLASVVIYGAAPLGYNAIATGRWAGVLVYGAMPWVVAAMARLSGLEPFGPAPGERVRPLVARLAGFTLLLALVTAFVPLFPLVAVAAAIALVLGSLPVGGWRGMGRMLGGTVVASRAALFLLHLPWGWTLPRSGNWSTLASVVIPGGERLGLSNLARLTTGPIHTSWLGWAFLAVLVIALLLARGCRLAWASRSMGMVVASLAVAWLGDRGTLGFGLPAIEVVLAPMAVGLALAAACGAAAVDQDVAGTRLSWRQPLGTVAAVAIAIALLPALAAVTDGAWKLGRSDFTDSLAFLPAQQQAGAFRVLWVGDPRNLPGTGWRLADGLAYELSQDGAPDVHDLWSAAPTRAEQLVADALGLASDAQTARLGRLLGPMGVRYIVVPLHRAPQAEPTPRHEPPPALLTALASQLDLREVDLDDALVVYENTTWMPERAQLSPAAAEASAEAGFDTLVRADVSGSKAVLPATGQPRRYAGDVAAGTVYLGSASSAGWHLDVDGHSVARRPAFGWANAFEVPAGGKAVLAYSTSPWRWTLVAAQVAVWVGAILLALGTVERRRRRTAGLVPVLIDLGDRQPAEPVAASVAAGQGGGLAPPAAPPAPPSGAAPLGEPGGSGAPAPHGGSPAPGALAPHGGPPSSAPSLPWSGSPPPSPPAPGEGGAP